MIRYMVVDVPTTRVCVNMRGQRTDRYLYRKLSATKMVNRIESTVDSCRTCPVTELCGKYSGVRVTYSVPLPPISLYLEAQ